MSWLGEYIHPLTSWLQQHPSWALFITFSVSLAESLAIIGSIVPGSVTMTTIGILAGSGIMRIDFTLMASILGAVCGDSLSYAIGYIYSDKLIYIWPFKRYPKLLNYGQEFFARHGGKSVLIGRFVGPLRSIIPVIAGIMHMKQWRFLIANVISAIGWSLLYVMPGVLIGVAGHELSTESATRLFIFILLLLVAVWLISLLIKWLFLRVQTFLNNNLHAFWSALEKNAFWKKAYTTLTPTHEKNHYSTACLVLFTLVSFILLLIYCTLVATSQLNNIDYPVFLFLQSLHTHLLQIAFIVCTQLTSTLTLATVYLFGCIWFVLQRDKRGIVYLSLLVITSTLLAYAMNWFIVHPRPEGIAISMTGSSFPNKNLLVATALYGFISFFIATRHTLFTASIRLLFAVILIFSGVGSLYLSDFWLSDILSSYFWGLFIALGFYIFYRKNLIHPHLGSTWALCLLLVFIFSSSATSLYLNYTFLLYAHTPDNKEYILDSESWWNQQTPTLPLYRMNRVGKTTNLLNVQYSGDLNLLSDALLRQGWKNQQQESFLKKIALHIGNNSTTIKPPILTQLYENKRPKLIMTYYAKHSQTLMQLMLWQSNYHLYQNNNPLWIGTLDVIIDKKTLQPNTDSAPVLDFITDQFLIKKLDVPAHLVKKTVSSNIPYILLIKPIPSEKRHLINS